MTFSKQLETLVPSDRLGRDKLQLLDDTNIGEYG